MKTNLILAAACALALPAAALAQSYPHDARHDGGRPAPAGPAVHAPPSNFRFANPPARAFTSNPGFGRAMGRPAYDHDLRDGRRFAAGERRYDRYGGVGFGLGLAAGAALAGGYQGGYGYAGYPAYDNSYAYAPQVGGYYPPDTYAPAYAYGGGPIYGYQTNDPGYVAGGYGVTVQDYDVQDYAAQDYAAQGYVQQGYVQQDYVQSSDGQAYQPAPSPYYGDGYDQGGGGAANGPACGQWAWDAPIGRYVWAC